MFRAWALVGAQMYAVPLRVPRTFYVDSALPPDDPDSPAHTLGGLRVQRTLPLGREPAHLYQARTLCPTLFTEPLRMPDAAGPRHACGCLRCS